MGAAITKFENVRVFDGYHLTDEKEVFFNSDGVIIEPADHADQVIDGQGKFLMPGLIDAHTHLTWKRNAAGSVRSGVTSTFAIASTDKVKMLPSSTRIFSTFYRAVGSVKDGREFVRNEVSHGAKYVKIVVEDPPYMARTTITQEVMNDIADEAHKNGLLVATHAVAVPTLKMAIAAGTDIHIHVPLEADIPDEMIQQIVKNGACCVPTLVMMKGFADSRFFGYHKEDYQHSVNNVRKLHDAGVPILAGSDASNVFILPTVHFGTDLHTEMKLLAAAGLTNEEVLQAATSTAAAGYRTETVGAIRPGRYADFVLIDGDPLENIGDIDRISQVWIGGKSVFTSKA